MKDEKEKGRVTRLGGFIKEEREGIIEYVKAKKVSKGTEKVAYGKILPEERKHLSILKKARKSKK